MLGIHLQSRLTTVPLRISLIAFALLFAVPGHAQLPGKGLGYFGWKVIGIPYVYGNSDDGLIFGVSAEATSPGGQYMQGYVQATSGGALAVRVKGELQFSSFRIVGRVKAQQGNEYLYPTSAVDPKWMARADVYRLEAQSAMLFEAASHLEIGPDVEVLLTDAKKLEDQNEQSLPDNSIARFTRGSHALIGVRLRYRTMDPIRPLRGFMVDGAFRIGRLGGATDIRFDYASEVTLAGAIPICCDLRWFNRMYGKRQMEATPPIQTELGGIKTLRGQPSGRDYGRTQLAGRSQVHWTIAHGWRGFFGTLHSIIHGIPAWKVDVETVAFYDVGMTGDPTYGWRKMRHGVGGGFRIVLPPTLVLRADVAVSPGGSPAFYIGVGEEL